MADEEEQKRGSLKNLKRPLECKMSVSKCYVEQEIRFSYFVWNVKNYKGMTQGVWYDTTFKTTGWLIRVLKTEDHIRLLIKCNARIQAIVCYVSPSWKDEIFSVPYETKKTYAETFELRIPRISVRDPEKNSDPDVLGLYFRYNMVENWWKNPAASRGIDEEEKDLFTDELASMLDSGKYSDCAICTPSKTHNVHKFVLASRSKVLREHFVKDGQDVLDVKSDVSPQAMELLLRYVYSGKLDLRKLNEHEVLEVLKLAIDWKIELLELRCISFLSFAFNLEGKKIREAVKERGACLSEKSKHFLKYVKGIVTL